MVDRLNDLTQAQMAEIRERALSKRADRACLWCGKVISMRLDQKFCCTAHRVSYAQASVTIAYEQMVMDKAAWQAERERLVREIAHMRHLLEQHGVMLPPPFEG